MESALLSAVLRISLYTKEPTTSTPIGNWRPKRRKKTDGLLSGFGVEFAQFYPTGTRKSSNAPGLDEGGHGASQEMIWSLPRGKKA
jgi:hypothetical protein